MARHKSKVEELRLEVKSGYAANGMSLYSRMARKPRGAGGDLSRTFVDHPPEHTVSELIERHQRELKKLEARLNSGNLTHAERAKLQGPDGNIEIKRRFLARLQAEYEAMIRTGANDVRS